MPTLSGLSGRFRFDRIVVLALTFVLALCATAVWAREPWPLPLAALPDEGAVGEDVLPDPASEFLLPLVYVLTVDASGGVTNCHFIITDGARLYESEIWFQNYKASACRQITAAASFPPAPDEGTAVAEGTYRGSMIFHVPASKRVIPFAMVDGWSIYRGEAGCAAVHETQSRRIVFRQTYNRNTSLMLKVNTQRQSRERTYNAHLTLGGMTYYPPMDWVLYDAQGVVLIATGNADARALFRAGAGRLLVTVDENEYVLEPYPRSMASFAALERCVDSSPENAAKYTHALDASRSAGVQWVSPRNNPEDWIKNDDYPTEALENQLEGAVGFSMTVDARGRPLECKVTSSSGHAILDEATCRLVQRRAKFRYNGEEFGTYSNRVRWVLPRPDLSQVPAAGPQPD
jgi:TonB family protein